MGFLQDVGNFKGIYSFLNLWVSKSPKYQTVVKTGSFLPQSSGSRLMISPCAPKEAQAALIASISMGMVCKASAFSPKSSKTLKLHRVPFLP